MKYLKQFEGEISKGEFEGLLGDKIEVVRGTGGATVTALEVTPDPSITSCTIYLDQAPPDWLIVGRQWPGGTDYHRDWKHEVVNAWDGEKYALSEQWFTHIEIVGGPYDINDPNAIGPFNFWLAAMAHHESIPSNIIKYIGWVMFTTYQHTNIYFSLTEEEPPDPPVPQPPIEPPIEPPPCDCNCEVAAQKVREAQGLLDEALELLDNCTCEEA